MSKILLIGRSGQVTTYLQPLLGQLAELVVVGSEQLNLAEEGAVSAVLNQIEPTLVINPAAYTAVDKAEEEPDLAYAINRDAVADMADWCVNRGASLIHFSTDYVFDGAAEKPYRETDPPAPTGVYGASKLAGERAILNTDANAIILRTSWVYSNHGKNFYRTMLNLAASRDELSVVADQIGSPSYAGSLATACAEIAKQLIEDPARAAGTSGVYHFTCGGQTSWHGFAQALFEANDITDIKVHPITTAEYPTPARRPAYSVLDNSKLEDVFGIRLPHWEQALKLCVEEVETDDS
jgi:dTDP-4-dehydrorhamnose reductase